MSTDHQRYSIANQVDAIHRYAQNHGMEVVRTYADKGKSGLTLDGRAALSKLLSDVQSEEADYSTILVLDVSRWGRFQDVDESAYYEHICKRSGIGVRYCAEHFKNDGSPISTIVKSIKRAMAAEYSRELSVKVFAGKHRIAQMGFWTGGPAAFGLRRMVIDKNGHPKGNLEKGEYKSAQTDRILLVPGPKREVRTVRWVFQAFVEQDLPESRIADDLNRRKLTTSTGRAWTISAVRRVLTNETYIGNHVWNRTSLKLGAKRVQHSPDRWVRTRGAFKPIVDYNQFEAAQSKIRERTRRYTEDDLLEALKRLWKSQGYLTSNSIDLAEGVPCSKTYHSRFGSLRKAYELVGYDTGSNYRFIDQTQSVLNVHTQTLDSSVMEIQRIGGHVEHTPGSSFLCVNSELMVFVSVARCRTTEDGSRKWLIRGDINHLSNLTMIVRMNETNRTALDYYLFPTTDVNRTGIFGGWLR